MILPNKHIDVDGSYLGMGGMLLELMVSPQTVSGLWEKAKRKTPVSNFERFTLVLSFLYSIDAVNFEKGLIRKATP